MEGIEFWAEHDEFLTKARTEWGHKHGILYECALLMTSNAKKVSLELCLLHAFVAGLSRLRSNS
jgi:hypothetical protein